MIWSYRAVKNPIARRKWLLFILAIILIFFGYGIYRIAIGDATIRVLFPILLFSLFIFLYTIIALGKPRHYLSDEEYIIYKPFKTKISEIRSYKVDERNLTIKLNKKGLFGVKTLYFEKIEDLREAERWLKKRISK